MCQEVNKQRPCHKTETPVTTSVLSRVEQDQATYRQKVRCSVVDCDSHTVKERTSPYKLHVVRLPPH